MTVQTPSLPASPDSGQLRLISRSGSRTGVRRLGSALLRSPSLLLAVIILTTVTVWAIVPDWVAPYDPLTGDASRGLLPPSWAHPFGTDLLGRDILSRVIAGTRTTLLATGFAVTVGGSIGAAIGLISGFAGGPVDAAIMRVVDVFLAVPGLLLAMTVVTALGHGTFNVAIAVAVGAVPAFARIMRAEVVRTKQYDFIEAAFVFGTRPARMMTRHILPNASPPVLALAALELGSAVISVASLGFLGYGATPPTPEWGLSVVEGRDLLGPYPWISLLPGVVITAVVLATNRLSTYFADGV